MKWASAVSRTPDTAAALGEVVERVGRCLGGRPPGLLLVFATPHHVRALDRVPAVLADAFPGAPLAGCSGRGVIGDGHEVEGSPALSLTAGWLPGVRVETFYRPPGELPPPEAGPGAWAGALGLSPDTRPHLLLFSDPFTGGLRPLLSGLDAAFPDQVRVGGIASGGRGPGSIALLRGDDLRRAGTVGVALSGDLAVDTVVAQGCRPVGPPHIVTRCEDNLVLALDGEPPLDVLRGLYDALGLRDRELLQSALFVGIEMQNTVEHREGEVLIRDVLGLDEDTGGLYVAEELERWQVVQFHVRDARSSDRDLRDTLDRYVQQLGDLRPAGGLLFSCVGRGEGLYGEPDHDSTVFHDHVGPVPLGGFFANGEIGPVQGRTWLHGYTSAFALFRPGGSDD